MAIAGQRSAQRAQTAGTQSARAMGRATRAGGAGMADELIVQLYTGWHKITCGEDGVETVTPYEMTLERKV